MKIAVLILGLVAVMGAALHFQIIQPIALVLLTLGGAFHSLLIAELGK